MSPLRLWMKHANQILSVETQKETCDILLGFQSEGTSRDREGKKLWEPGGKYEPRNSKSKKLHLPSSSQFTKMTKATLKYSELNIPENVQRAIDLKKWSLFVTFLSNLYSELAEQVSSEVLIMLFNDYPYFYQIARTTKGPPPRISGDG